MATGKVYLIGAGPGDIELLTLKAVKRLQLCDVVLVDDLVNPEVLRLACDQAEIIYVGKRNGHEGATPQSVIDEMLVSLARAGKQIARLKGGDPFIFGRGGEELEALLKAGVEVEVVSGVTSGIAVPATLGICLSHRAFASGITFISGHSCSNDNLDWQSLVKGKTTIVIYMGMTNLPDIVDLLLKHGMPGDTPAAVIQNGTLAQQRNVITNISELPEAVRHLSLGPPAIIVIGEVVNMARLQPHNVAKEQAAEQPFVTEKGTVENTSSVAPDANEYILIANEFDRTETPLSRDGELAFSRIT